ncbi:MAG: hypothetical protein GF398_17420 [Chitinivibrionales bacterium]|nr:hypothetical protein [Chitinivibrionales bacterium]
MPDNVEFFRNCFVLADAGFPDVEAVIIQDQRKKKRRAFCSCTRGDTPDCQHVRLVRRGCDALYRLAEDKGPHETILASPLWRMVVNFVKSHPVSVGSISISHESSRKGQGALTVSHSQNQVCAELCGDEGALNRLKSRLDLAGRNEAHSRFERAWKAARFVLSDTEKKLLEHDRFSQQLSLERSFWFRIMYHFFCEYGFAKVTSELKLKSATGQGVLDARFAEGARLSIPIPDDRLPALAAVAAGCGIALPFTPRTEKCSLYFKLKTLKSKIHVLPHVCIDFGRNGRTCRPFKHKLLFGHQYYFGAEKAMAAFDFASIGLISQGLGKEQVFKREEFARFLESQRYELSLCGESDTAATPDLFGHVAEVNFGRLLNVTRIVQFESVIFHPHQVDASDCIARICFCAGKERVPLQTLHKACSGTQRYLVFGEALIDCASNAINHALVPYSMVSDDLVGIKKSSVIRLQKSTDAEVLYEGDAQQIDKLKRMLALAPFKPVKKLRGLKAQLRGYQKKGLTWLLFLYDNGLGGLLCDDMGLGKTHQAMALMAAVRELRNASGTFLVVCPTSVMSHWLNLVTRYLPGFSAQTYHGADRMLDELRKPDVIFTSYGVMRRDVDRLSTYGFAAAFFDEAQHMKNRESINCQCGLKLKAPLKFCLTGTPVENSLRDMKTLFDIVLPGFFENDARFEEQFRFPIEVKKDTGAIVHFKRITAPFLLRRTKERVARDLPPKIEDVRWCTLSPLQYELYHQALEARARPLISQLKEVDGAIPYMHIFALLNYFKRLCNHPVLVKGDIDMYDACESGKWELFKEILAECLDSGHKVVVFSQYLGMIEIIKKYLAKLDITAAILTGSTIDRGRVLSQFDTDPDCRVFLGSLRAAGFGVDLVAASIVIHYDRWWNAAREDQATDRVHRIGQKKGVQVFKFITAGSFEEKIHRIIERKKRLARDALLADREWSLKSFSRKELIELMSQVA